MASFWFVTYFLEFLSLSAWFFFLSLLLSLLLFDKDVYKKHSDIFLFLHLEILSGFFRKLGLVYLFLSGMTLIIIYLQSYLLYCYNYDNTILLTWDESKVELMTKMPLSTGLRNTWGDSGCPCSCTGVVSRPLSGEVVSILLSQGESLISLGRVGVLYGSRSTKGWILKKTTQINTGKTLNSILADCKTYMFLFLLIEYACTYCISFCLVIFKILFGSLNNCHII